MQGQYRVCQNLNLSRALGDLRYKTALDETGPDKQVIAGINLFLVMNKTKARIIVTYSTKCSAADKY